MIKIKIWKTVSQYVHLETGEVLTKCEAEKNYIILKKTKHVRINNENKSATIYYVYECTRTGSHSLVTSRIDGTPFTMVIDNHRNVEENCFLAMGEHRITEWNSHDNLQTMIETKDWTLIANSTIQWILNILVDMNETKNINTHPRAGANPLIVKAIGVDNHNTYPIVSDEDANKILVENSATGFLNRCAVVFLS